MQIIIARGIEVKILLHLFDVKDCSEKPSPLFADAPKLMQNLKYQFLH